MLRYALLLLSLCAMPAQALTVFGQGGYRFGSTLSSQTGGTVEREDGGAWGVTLHFPYHTDSGLELLASHGEAAVESAPGAPVMQVSHLLFGGIKTIEDGQGRPFLGTAFGMSRLALADDDVWRPAWMLYGGLEWPLAASVRVRAEMRWIGTWFGSATSLSCGSACRVSIDEGTRTELEAMFGIGIDF